MKAVLIGFLILFVSGIPRLAYSDETAVKKDDGQKASGDWFAGSPPHERAFVQQVLLPNMADSADVEVQNATYSTWLTRDIPIAKGKQTRAVVDTVVFSGEYSEKELKPETSTNVDVQQPEKAGTRVAMILVRKKSPDRQTRCAIVDLVEITDVGVAGIIDVVLIEQRFNYVEGKWKLESKKWSKVP